MTAAPLVVGLDAGTSMIKAVAFTLDGTEIAVAATRNRYDTGADGAVTQSPDLTWRECAATLRQLGAMVPDLAARIVALGVTGQGDGTWLIDAEGAPVGDGWLWLDSRAAAITAELSARDGERARFEITGTGLTACQQAPQLAWMQRHAPEALARAATAFHCKDWLYFRMTGQRATDPTEACFTFGDFRSRSYDERVVEQLGLAPLSHLMPPIVDGVREWHPLLPDAAEALGLRPGTPVVLGYIDAICTALGAGVVAGGQAHGCSILGSTGVHLRGARTADVVLPEESVGYVMLLPLPDMVVQLLPNMACTLNLDWILGLGAGLAGELGQEVALPEMIERLDGWLAATTPAELIYHPYISTAGERGPFVDTHARAGFAGLSTAHGYPHLVRAVAEGLAMAARDCYTAIGGAPGEVRLTGGAARSEALRALFAAVLGRPVRRALRAEAGAAGAAMIAAVATGAQPGMEVCLDAWVTPQLGPLEHPDPDAARRHDSAFAAYRAARIAMAPHRAGIAALAGPGLPPG